MPADKQIEFTGRFAQWFACAPCEFVWAKAISLWVRRVAENASLLHFKQAQDDKQ
jgi:hypothetical protein